MSLDLEKQLRHYGSYHHNTVNVVIHLICVPTIIMTTLVLLANGPSIPTPAWLSHDLFPLKPSTIASAAFATVYLLMEPVAGLMGLPLIIAVTAWANHQLSIHGATANYWAGSIFVLSWLMQFVGHGVFEGRAPALLDNLVQALVLAPFFVFFELLFKLGYRPDLKRRLDLAVKQDIQNFQGAKAENPGSSADASKKRA